MEGEAPREAASGPPERPKRPLFARADLGQPQFVFVASGTEHRPWRRGATPVPCKEADGCAWGSWFFEHARSTDGSYRSLCTTSWPTRGNDPMHRVRAMSEASSPTERPRFCRGSTHRNASNRGRRVASGSLRAVRPVAPSAGGPHALPLPQVAGAADGIARPSKSQFPHAKSSAFLGIPENPPSVYLALRVRVSHSAPRACPRAQPSCSVRGSCLLHTVHTQRAVDTALTERDRRKCRGRRGCACGRRKPSHGQRGSGTVELSSRMTRAPRVDGNHGCLFPIRRSTKHRFRVARRRAPVRRWRPGLVESGAAGFGPLRRRSLGLATKDPPRMT